MHFYIILQYCLYMQFCLYISTCTCRLISRLCFSTNLSTTILFFILLPLIDNSDGHSVLKDLHVDKSTRAVGGQHARHVCVCDSPGNNDIGRIAHTYVTLSSDSQWPQGLISSNPWWIRMRKTRIRSFCVVNNMSIYIQDLKERSSWLPGYVEGSSPT